MDWAYKFKFKLKPEILFQAMYKEKNIFSFSNGITKEQFFTGYNGFLIVKKNIIQKQKIIFTDMNNKEVACNYPLTNSYASSLFCTFLEMTCFFNCIHWIELNVRRIW